MRVSTLARSVIAAIGAAFVMQACGDKGTTEPRPPVVAAVTVTPGADTATALGLTRQFTAVAHDVAGTPIPGKAFTWQSSAPGVATVSATGLVTAVANGNATITASVDGVNGTAGVAVAQDVASVTVTPPTTSLAALGATAQFSAVAKDANNNTVAGVVFIWLSSDHNVAVVTPTGLATATGPGGAVIVAAARGVPGAAALQVDPPAPVRFALAVSRAGPGTVTSTPDGIYCGANCDETYAQGTTVTLTPTADAGATFAGWSGACTGTGPCIVTMDAAKLVTATFQASPTSTFALTVTRTGGGTVASAPLGIYCGVACTSSFAGGTMVTLTAAPDPGSTFSGWSGACSGTAQCVVTVDAATSVSATFATSPTPTFALAVTRTGNGTVASTPLGIYCGVSCTSSFTSGTVVTLTAAPDPGSTFMAWSGACSGTGPCTVSMDAAKNVSAEFSGGGPAPVYTLTVNRGGFGSVTSAPSGIACGTSCVAGYASGTAVTLTAAPDAGAGFVGWSGACTGTGSCSVVMDASRNVGAEFAALYALTVVTGGAGTGTVSSTPPGIACGMDCSESYLTGTRVTLAPTPALGSVFGGWQGACVGVGACNVTLDAAKSVTATFTAATPTLTVAKFGTGTGVVTSSPPGISCGADCSEAYPGQTIVTLTAAPDPGSLHIGWFAPACPGVGACAVTMGGSQGVTARFGLSRRVTVSLAGAGSVVSAPAGIDCGSDCTEDFGEGASVQLTATPGPGLAFDRWTAGPCLNGINPVCGFVIGATAVTATASFQPPVTLTVTAPNGSVRSVPPGIDCGADCSEAYALGRVVTLVANPTATYYFTGWSGACSGTAGCAITMDADKAVTATYAPKVPLRIALQPSGPGFVFLTAPAGERCADACTQYYLPGASVTLGAGTTDTGSVFLGWGGACGGTAGCTLVMDTERSVTAKWGWRLKPTMAGDGAGTLNISPLPVGCDLRDPRMDPMCLVFPDGAAITITVSLSGSSILREWMGCDTVVSGSCRLTMRGPRTVTAVLDGLYVLHVSKPGDGVGTVVSYPMGINCGADCNQNYLSGTDVWLTAVAASGSVFAGWSQACTGVGDCKVTMFDPRGPGTIAAAATFLALYPLAVTKAGTGSGVVTSAPAGINCGTDCAEDYASGKVVTLTAAATAGWAFLGWSGACTGTATFCTITMDAAKSVTATFGPGNTLTVGRAGAGRGVVTSAPGGINCSDVSPDCAETYAPGTVVTLTASPFTGNIFTGWSGACAGTATTCSVTMDVAKSVTATFSPSFSLSVSQAGRIGLVTSSPAGINCGTDCSGEFAAGSVVTLTATPPAGATFGGWSGACTGTATTCSVTMTAAKSVIATFN